MKLNNPLITSFEFENEKHDIDLAFNNVLDTFEVNAKKDLYDHEKAEINLSILLDGQPVSNPIETWNYIYENFIASGAQELVKVDLEGNPLPEEKDDSSAPYDIKQDASYIYASFQQAYGINLYEQQGKLHWLEFRALLNGLPSNTIFQRVIEIRTWNPEKGDSAEHIKDMRALQDAYKLHDESEVEE